MTETKLIGNKIVRLGYVSIEEITESLEEQKRRQANGKPVKLGELLIERGMLTAQQLNTVLDIKQTRTLPLADDSVRLAVKLKAALQKENTKTVLFTGIGQSHNTDSVVSQIAHSLTLLNMGKVLLIDANSQKPVIHHKFGIAKTPGLMDVLSQRAELSDSIYTTEIANLFLLPIGSTIDTTYPQVQSSHSATLLQELSKEFSAIIIHAADILDYAETVFLASHVDKVIAVGACGIVKRSQLDELKHTLEGLDTYFAGVVLSDVKKSQRPQGKKIKVLHLLHTMDYGGVETIIVNWLKTLNRTIFDVHIVCFANPGQTEHLFIEAASREGFQVRTIPWSRRKPVIKASRQLMEIIRDLDADIIHTHNLYADMVGLIAGKITKRKLVSSLYVWVNIGWKRKLLQWINKWILRGFDLVTTQCEKTLRATHARGIRQHKVKILHSGFKANTQPLSISDKKQIRQQYGASDKHIVLANVARLYPEKAQNILLDNFKIIHERFPHIRLWMLGRGPLEQDLKQYCQQLGLMDVVTFTGFVSNLNDVLQAVDIQVHPSHTEGIPMAVLSGMANKLPIIASSVGGIPEVLEHGCSGILVPPAGDRSFSQMFVDATSHLVEHKEQRDMLATNAYYFIQHEYSLEKAAATLEQMYRELLVS